jgi:hypothetical protein
MTEQNTKDINGDEWNHTDRLLAAAVHALRVANWQRTADGAKGVNYPQFLFIPSDPRAFSDALSSGPHPVTPEDKKPDLSREAIQKFVAASLASPVSEDRIRELIREEITVSNRAINRQSTS